MRWRLSLVACVGAAAAAAVLMAPRAQAITYGFVDTHNAFPNVGAFIVQRPDGQIFPICSGTLIATTSS